VVEETRSNERAIVGQMYRLRKKTGTVGEGCHGNQFGIPTMREANLNRSFSKVILEEKHQNVGEKRN